MVPVHPAQGFVMSYPPAVPPSARPLEYPAYRQPEPEPEPPPPSGRPLILLLALLLVVVATAIYLSFPRIDSLRKEVFAAADGILDVATLPMPFETPRASAPTQLGGAAPLAPEAQTILALRRAFFEGDFTSLEQGLTALRESGRAEPRASVPFSPFLESLDDTLMAGLDRCNQWLALMPESYLAHWTCAKIWNSGAWDARTGASRSQLTQAQIALMRQRMEMSNRLLEQALLLDPTPFEALSQLAHNHFVSGSGLGHHYLNQAESVEPRYVSMHRQRIHFAQPQWGGSMEAVAAAIERARQVGLEEDDLIKLQEIYYIRPDQMASPGAGRDYWYRVLEEKVMLHRLQGLLEELAPVNNWKAMVPVAEQMVELYPGQAEGHKWLGQALMQQGHAERARAAMLTAAALGSDDALEELILANIRGGLGIEGGDLQGIAELCHYGAALGSRVGGNCLGAGSFEGISPEVPFEYDPAQGYAWHLLAARGGHYNSQFDLGWMLYTGRVPGVTPEDARVHGVFWLRRAAEKGHRFAGARLDEMGLSRSEWTLVGYRDSLDQLLSHLKVVFALLADRVQALRGS
jgi:tetratricopeptide (TPR) repeat protein